MGPEYVHDLWLLFRVVVAAALSAPLGWERERQDRPAGLRTHILVGMSSALLVVLSRPMVEYLDFEKLGIDPTRVPLTVITGVAFLGAGTIFVHREEKTVRGLTTAGSLLYTASLGIAVGLGEWILAIGTTVIVAFVLAGLRRFQDDGDGGEGADDE